MRLLNTKSAHFWENMRFMFRHSWKLAKKSYFHCGIQAIFDSLKPLVVLIIPKYILDELAEECRAKVIFAYIALYALALAFFHLTSFLLHWHTSVHSIKTSHRTNLFNKKKWLYMDYGQFENGQVRDLAEKCIGQLDPAAFIEGTIFGLFTNVIQLAGYTYIVMSLHPIILVLILIIIGLNTLIVRKLNRIGYEYQPIITRISRRLGYVFNTMVDFNVGREVRINGAATWLNKKYNNETENYMECYKRNQKKQYTPRLLAMLLDLIQTVIFYGYCGYLAINGNISVGHFSMFLGAISLFTNSFTGLLGRFSNIKLLSKYVDDYREFLTISEHKGKEKEKNNIPDGKFDIRFENVSFKYPNTDRYVLKKINITIKNGERLSVVGYNGAGKTTFIKLLCRLYEPTEGKIFVGDIDISTIPLAKYRKLLSVVFQDHERVGLTIRDNIIMNKEYNEERLNFSVDQSGLRERIDSLKNGIDTMLFRIYDYDAVIFSGGENQKLVCARAYYKDSPIVILDEPTASLDPIAEANLYERFNSIIGNKTSIYISHRLASVRFCDSIAVFVDGEIVEYGSHTELMNNNGVYTDLFKKQASYYVQNECERGEE